MIITRNSTTPAALRETMSTTQSMFRVAAIQMASGPNVQANLQEGGRVIELAAANGGRILGLTESFAIMGMKDTDKVAAREKDGVGPIQNFLAAEARRHRVWIVGGSVPLESSLPDKVRNSCLVYDQEGKRVARYDKIHLFGFDMGSERYTEERTIEPGKAICTVDSPYGKLGISVCYDLRFPELYRAMGDVDLILVPSAFTETTGKAHWDTLTRARPTVNPAAASAPAPGAHHGNGRVTDVHPIIISPWRTDVDSLRVR